MKYSLNLPPQAGADYVRQAPRTGYGRVIGAICVLFGCFTWSLLLLGHVS